VKNRSLHDIERSRTQPHGAELAFSLPAFCTVRQYVGRKRRANVCTKLKAETKLDFLSYHTSMNIRAIDVAIFITQNKCSVYAFAESEKNFFFHPRLDDDLINLCSL
jgi:hypothetical protein